MAQGPSAEARTALALGGEMAAALVVESSPPFRPDVSNEQDTKYVPSAYLKLEAKDSIVKPAPGAAGASARGQWDDFTYVNGSPLSSPAAAAADGAAASK